jgi:hypothetical protein
MSIWLDTRGYTSLAVAVCDRCKMKRSITELVSDPNAPGTYVCQRDCVDQYDPWRLPAREPEDITLEHPRPDLPLS